MLRKLGIFGLGLVVSLSSVVLLPKAAQATQSVCWKEQRVIRGYYQEVTVCENESSSTNAYNESILQSTIYGNGGYVYPNSSYYGTNNYGTSGIYFGVGNGGFNFPFGFINNGGYHNNWHHRWGGHHRRHH
jgi:hypothetical protein